MLARWLLLGLAVWLLLGWARKRRGAAPVSKAEVPSGDGVRRAATMVPCQACGVHLPLADALPGTDDTGAAIYFCGAPHRDAFNGKARTP